jgi:hypothetical protein
MLCIEIIAVYDIYCTSVTGEHSQWYYISERKGKGYLRKLYKQARVINLTKEEMETYSKSIWKCDDLIFGMSITKSPLER